MTITGDNMKIKREKGWTSIEKDGCTIVTVVNKDMDSRSPFSKEEATEIVEDIYDKLKMRPTIQHQCDRISVVKGCQTLIVVYWGERDKWRYGIRTKEEAIEIASEFVRLYSLDTLPQPIVCPIKYSYDWDGVSVVDINGNTLAKFSSKSNARCYFRDYLDNNEINNDGLKSHHSGWDRSIRRGTIKGKELKRYILLLLDYIDENWGRCD